MSRKHGLGVVATPPPSPANVGSQETGAYAPYLEPARHVVLRFETCEHTPQKLPVWRSILDRFRAARPDIRVRLSERPFSLQRTDGESLPDILHAAAWSVAELGCQGKLLNLSSWVGAGGSFEGDLLDASVSPADEDPCWGVPISFDIGIAFLNLRRNRLEDMRANWDLEGIVEWARRHGRGDARTVGFPRPHALLAFCGVDAFDLEELEANVARLPGVLEEVRRLQDACPFYERGRMDGDYVLEAYRRFADGDLPLTFFHTFAIPDVLRRATFPWAALPLPVPAGFPVRRISLCCALSRQCASPEAAMAFVRFLAGPEGQEVLAGAKNNVPVLASAARSAAFVSPPPEGLERVVRSISRTREWPARGGQAFGLAYQSAWDEEIAAFLFGERSLSEAVGNIEGRSRGLLKAYGLV